MSHYLTYDLYSMTFFKNVIVSLKMTKFVILKLSIVTYISEIYLRFISVIRLYMDRILYIIKEFVMQNWNQVLKDFLRKSAFDIILYLNPISQEISYYESDLLFESNIRIFKCFTENRINGFKLYGTAENGTTLLIYNDVSPTQNRNEIFIDSSHMLDVPIKVITIAEPNSWERILTLCEVFVYGI